MVIDTGRTGAAAEKLVTGQLLRRGLDAFEAYARSPGYDVVVASPNGTSQVRVQVKASSGGRANPWVYVKAKSCRQFDVLVFVDLGGERENYHVIPEALLWTSHHVPLAGSAEHEGMTLKSIARLDACKDAWHNITDLLASRAAAIAASEAS